MKVFDYHRTIIGYHGCEESTAKAVLAGKKRLRLSRNKYDWLGRGIYFWEHGPQRAKDWARTSEKIKKPAVLGALIHLGDCFDLLDTRYTNLLSKSFTLFAETFKKEYPNKSLPKNKGKGMKQRNLDCFMMNVVIPGVEREQGRKFQSVRCVFVEGDAVFPGSEIMQESHIQIAIRDPRCILGYFRPS